MKITNKYNLSETMVRALTPREYQPDPNRIGVTALIDSPLIRILKLKHHNDITYEVSDNLWAFHGNVVDEMLKKFATEDDKTDIKMEVIVSDGLREITLVGKPDFVNEKRGVLTDLKYTSVWSVLHGIKPEWEAQVNLYYWMYSRLFPKGAAKINRLEIQAVMRDWIKNKAGQGDYPKAPEHIFNIPIWSQEYTELYIDNRIFDHFNNPTRECTPEEKWQSEDTYAVVKKNQKRAVRVLTSEIEAKNYIAAHKDATKLSIEKRPGICKRCENYCGVKEFCPYYKGK